MEQETVVIDLRDLLFLLKKNFLILIIFPVLGAVAAYLFSAYLLDPRYEASTTLVVNTRDDQATVVTYDQINSAKQLVDTYAVVLTNDSLMNKIIQEFQLDDTIESLRSRITADAVNQTQVMRITMTDKSSEIAQGVLEEIVKSAPDILVNTVKAGSVEIVSPPRIDPTPVFPRTNLNILIGALGGLGLAFCYIFVRKAINNTFMSDDDVDRYLSLPVIGVIPSIKK